MPAFAGMTGTKKYSGASLRRFQSPRNSSSSVFFFYPIL
jgi:hypothetical protein